MSPQKTAAAIKAVLLNNIVFRSDFMKLLIIDSDKKTAQLTSDCLMAYRYSCDIVSDDSLGFDMLMKNDEYVGVILESKLAIRDGYYLCSQIRQKKKLPVIFISSQTDEADIIRAFSVGADDYITKPYSISEMVARVNGHITRYLSITESVQKKNQILIKNRGLKIDKNSHRVYINNQEIPMPVKEYELLLFLAENPNIVFSKEHLFDRVWGMDAIGDSSTVTVHIQRIREKINGIDGNTYIETVWGAGYRMSTE